MMISTRGRYALRVMIDIAVYANGSYVSLKEISERQEISVKYLEQVVALLNKAGFLQSLRGNNGGYKLTRHPSEYTAGDILRAAEGSLAPIACLKNETNDCERREKCTTLPFWENYYKTINDYVNSVTLQDLVDETIALTTDNYSI